MSNFLFSPGVFKRLVLQTCKNQGLFGKGLRKVNFMIYFPCRNAKYGKLCSNFLYRNTLGNLTASGRVNGVMVIHVPRPKKEKGDLYEIPGDFSPDKSCPNDDYGKFSA